MTIFKTTGQLSLLGLLSLLTTGSSSRFRLPISRLDLFRFSNLIILVLSLNRITTQSFPLLWSFISLIRSYLLLFLILYYPSSTNILHSHIIHISNHLPSLITSTLIGLTFQFDDFVGPSPRDSPGQCPLLLFSSLIPFQAYPLIVSVLLPGESRSFKNLILLFQVTWYGQSGGRIPGLILHAIQSVLTVL